MGPRSASTTKAGRISLIELKALLSARFSLLGTHRGRGVRVYGRLLVRGRSGIGIGSEVSFGPGGVATALSTQPGGRLVIGQGSCLGHSCIVQASQLIEIGQRCQIGQQVIILDNDMHGLPVHLRRVRPLSAPVVIEDDVSIGDRAVILPGVRLGAGSVIAPGSIVTADVATLTAVAGVPAKLQTQKVSKRPA